MLGQQILSGLATGSLYALTAVAVVVVFRNVFVRRGPDDESEGGETC
jgi:hypothetical protein